MITNRIQFCPGHFHFGKYIDSMMQSRVVALASEYFDEKILHGVDEDLVRTSVIYRDAVCQEYILSAMKHYAIALRLDSKHVYQALPRLLSLWFDFVSIDPSQQIVPEGFNSSGYNSKSQNVISIDFDIVGHSHSHSHSDSH